MAGRAILVAMIGIWLMIAPAIIPHDSVMENHNRIMGPLIFSISIISISEVTRNLRWLNCILAIWIFIYPMAFKVMNVLPAINYLVAGLVILYLSVKKGKTTKTFGGGWNAIFKRDN
ncbi:MAG: hypothetical protein ACK40G_03835 [Cytophagaceae bacterium]